MKKKAATPRKSRAAGAVAQASKRKAAARKKAATEAGEGKAPTAARKRAAPKTKSAAKADAQGRAHRRRMATRVRTLAKRVEVLKGLTRGLSYAEIGEQTGMTASQVGVIVREIRDDLEDDYSNRSRVWQAQAMRQALARMARSYDDLERADGLMDRMWAQEGQALAEEAGAQSADEARAVTRTVEALTDRALRAQQGSSQLHIKYLELAAKLGGWFAPDKVEVGGGKIDDAEWLAGKSVAVIEAVRRRMAGKEGA